jgi:hypothetical protein
MKKLFLLLTVVTLAFLSCQKEIDWGLGVSADQTLIRIKSKTGATDTTQVDYSFDAGKRLVRELTNGIGAGQDLNNDLVIIRNTSGIITKTIQKAAALLAAGIDSVVTVFNYNTSTSRYTSSVFTIVVAGFGVKDSAVYTYNVNAMIAMDEHYLSVTGLPIPLPPLLSARNTYTYSSDGKNLLSVATDASLNPGDPLTPASAQNFTFDAKKNPLIILNEAILIGRAGLYNANNATKTVLSNTIDPTLNFTMDYTFKYNTGNKPDSSTGTRTPGGDITVTKYYYQ